jgi:uncharacterized protein (TIGR02466 family)
MKVAYFQPTVIAIDNVPPVEFSKIFNLVENLHSHPELSVAPGPLVNIRGGNQIQVYPNEQNLDVSWLVKWIETACQGYMELIAQQSGTEDLRMCKAVVASIWTIRQGPGDYQEMHTHPVGHISGNIYVSAPQLNDDSNPSDGQAIFRLPQTRDVTRFMMNDNWKYTPEPGTILVFPSHLPHAVYPWKGIGHRTVLSFDARLVPKDE